MSPNQRGVARDIGALESAVAQPLASFGDKDLYPPLIDKAAAPGLFVDQEPRVFDGNKRLSHAAMEVLLLLNGHEVECGVDEQEAFWPALAAGERSREELVVWLTEHARPGRPTRR